MSASIAKSCPQLYKAGIDNLYFKWKVILVWLGFALYQSLIFFIVPLAAGMSAQNSSSIMLGVWDIGTLAYTCIIITVNLRLLMASGHITIWHQFSVGGSIVGWFLFLYFYSCVQSSWRQVQLFLAIQFRIQNENFAFLMFVRFHL
jgi:phospholipid-transporting ATPase